LLERDNSLFQILNPHPKVTLLLRLRSGRAGRKNNHPEEEQEGHCLIHENLCCTC
jgi:hypothetical protein